MNLYEKMQQCYAEEYRDWNYYGQPFINPFEDKIINLDFIHDYFNYGGKSMVISELINIMDPMRHSHTISSFFIGMLIKQQICPNLRIVNSPSNEFEFSYLWFIVCLFHDMGYAQERDCLYKYNYENVSREYSRQYRWIIHPAYNVNRHEYSDLGIIFPAPSKFYMMSLFGTKSAYFTRTDESNGCGIRFNNGIEIKKSRYSRNTVLNYLEYCKMAPDIKHYDHGIVGGLW